MITAVFISGRAHGWKLGVQDDTTTVHVSMVSGTPEAFLPLDHPGVKDQLNRVSRQWESYYLIAGLEAHPDGNYAFYCSRPLPPPTDPPPDLQETARLRRWRIELQAFAETFSGLSEITGQSRLLYWAELDDIIKYIPTTSPE